MCIARSREVGGGLLNEKISVIAKDGEPSGKARIQTLIGAAMEAGFTHAAPLKAETL